MKKRFFSILVAFSMLASIFVFVIPANASDYNTKYFRYPVSATYEPLGEEGFARGELTVNVNTWVNNNEGGCPIDAVVYWANEKGKLEGYSHLARFKLSTRATTFSFPELQMIPEGADRLRVYTSIHGTDIMSERSVEAMLPEYYDYVQWDDPIMSFVVLSDTHVKSDNTAAQNQKFKDMLRDVEKLVPDAAGIFINGDNVQSVKSGSDTATLKTQLQKVMDYSKEICPDIPVFMGVGNHDLWPFELYEDAKNTFLSVATLPDGSHPESLNYDFWLDGYHFVFIGDDDGSNPDPTYATISSETLQWLDDTLAEDYDKGRPTFIFLHQAISNTVAGSLTDFGEEWDGIINAFEVKKVLRKYPEAILFSGHSHFSMDSIGNAYPGGSIFPTTFNTASLGSMSGEYADEAQGYIIEIYEDTVLVKGRDFASDEWKASAQYAVKYDEGSSGSNEKPATKPTEKVTEAPTEPATEPSSESLNNVSDQGAEEPKKSGCASTVDGGIALAVILPVAVCMIRRKKED